MSARIGSLLLAGVLGLATLPGGARAQGSDAATIAELRRQLDEMRRRLEQLEARTAPPARAPAAPRQAARAPAPAPQAEARAAAAEARAAAAEARAAQAAIVAAPSPFAPTVPGLQPPEPMGDQTATAMPCDPTCRASPSACRAPTRRCGCMASPR